MSTVKETVTALETALAELTERARRQSQQLERVTARAEELEQRLARGTSDHTEAAGAAVAEFDAEPTKPGTRVRRPRRTTTPPPVAPPRDVAAELEHALRTKPAGIAELARTLRVPVNHVAIALRTLKAAGRVYNVGTAEDPQWTWVVGDDASTPEIAAAVEMLIRYRPMSFRELLAATGSRRGRVSGVLVAIQRAGGKVENRGTDRRWRWFLPR